MAAEIRGLRPRTAGSHRTGNIPGRASFASFSREIAPRRLTTAYDLAAKRVSSGYRNLRGAASIELDNLQASFSSALNTLSFNLGLSTPSLQLVLQPASSSGVRGRFMEAIWSDYIFMSVKPQPPRGAQSRALHEAPPAPVVPQPTLRPLPAVPVATPQAPTPPSAPAQPGAKGKSSCLGTFLIAAGLSIIGGAAGAAIGGLSGAQYYRNWAIDYANRDFAPLTDELLNYYYYCGAVDGGVVGAGVGVAATMLVGLYVASRSSRPAGKAPAPDARKDTEPQKTSRQLVDAFTARAAGAPRIAETGTVSYEEFVRAFNEVFVPQATNASPSPGAISPSGNSASNTIQAPLPEADRLELASKVLRVWSADRNAAATATPPLEMGQHEQALAVAALTVLAKAPADDPVHATIRTAIVEPENSHEYQALWRAYAEALPIEQAIDFELGVVRVLLTRAPDRNPARETLHTWISSQRCALQAANKGNMKTAFGNLSEDHPLATAAVGAINIFSVCPTATGLTTLTEADQTLLTTVVVILGAIQATRTRILLPWVTAIDYDRQILLDAVDTAVGQADGLPAVLNGGNSGPSKTPKQIISAKVAERKTTLASPEHFFTSKGETAAADAVKFLRGAVARTVTLNTYTKGTTLEAAQAAVASSQAEVARLEQEQRAIKDAVSTINTANRNLTSVAGYTTMGPNLSSLLSDTSHPSAQAKITELALKITAAKVEVERHKAKVGELREAKERAEAERSAAEAARAAAEGVAAQPKDLADLSEDEINQY